MLDKVGFALGEGRAQEFKIARIIDDAPGVVRRVEEREGKLAEGEDTSRTAGGTGIGQHLAQKRLVA